VRKGGIPRASAKVFAFALDFDFTFAFDFSFWVAQRFTAAINDLFPVRL
jgi:hypothetical protein